MLGYSIADEMLYGYRTLIAAIKAVPKGVAVLVHNDGVLWDGSPQEYRVSRCRYLT
jgi:hypothetical protein